MSPKLNKAINPLAAENRPYLKAMLPILLVGAWYFITRDHSLWTSAAVIGATIYSCRKLSALDRAKYLATRG